MSIHKPFKGPFNGPVTDLLPDEFDFVKVADFFATSKPLKGLQHASDVSHADLPGLAVPLEALDDIASESGDGAGARPSWKGDGGGKGGIKKGKPAPADDSDTSGGTTDTSGGTTDTGGGTTDTSGGTTDTSGGTTDTSGGTTDTGGTTPVSADYVSGLDTPNGYNISIDFAGSWTDSMRQAVVDAAEWISDIVIGDVADSGGIDDLHITASITSIDGTGGYFGWGGSSSTRSGSGLPDSGYLKLDSADVAMMQSYNVADDFAFHEMLHAMGFGTGWSGMGLVTSYNGDLRFTGANATAAYNADYAAIAANDPLSAYGVPVETDGGSGTAGLHWDHATFGSEMMTGTLGVNNVVSSITTAALEDMGYETIFDSANYHIA